MAVNVATLVARLEADIRDFDKDMKTANKRIRDLEGNTKKAGGAFKNMGKLMGGIAFAAVGRKVLQLGKEMVMLAVDAEEAGSAFRTTFGPAVGRAQQFVDEFANKAGFATFELQQLLAVTGNVVQGLGATEEVSAELSERMATLAGDVASFSNAAGGAPGVLKALQSALTGEREALKTYGIVISEAEVQQRALLETGKEHATELTRLEKAQATVTLAFERAGKAVGDLDRTQDDAANSLRRLNAEFTEAKAVAGAELVPLLEDLIPLMGDLLVVIKPIGGALKGIAGGFTAVAHMGAGLVGVFNKNVRATNQLWLNLAVLEEAGFKTEDAFKNVAFVMGSMSKEGSLTVGVVDEMQSALGATNEELLRAAEFTQDLYGDSDVLTTVIKDLNRELANEEADLWEVQRAADAARRSSGDLVGETVELRDAYVRAERAVRNFARALLSQSDPVFGALDAFERMNDALEDTEASLIDQGLAVAEAAAAFGSLTDSQITAAIDLLATSLGIARDRARELLIEAGLLDGKRIAINFAVDYEGLRGGIPEGINPNPPRRPRKQIPEFASGGMVPGPVGRPQLAVVHGGEEITPVGGGGGVTVIQNITDDFRDPAAARRIIRELARELDDYRRETVR